MLLGVVGICFEVVINPSVTGRPGGLLGSVGAVIAHPVTLAAGLAMTAVCLLAVAWTASVLVAARREQGSASAA